MRRDLKNNVKVSPGLAVALSGTTNVVGASVDMDGYDSVMFAACFGTLAATGLAATLVVEESDDDSAWSDVTEANDLIRAGAADPAVTHADDDVCVTIGYVGNKRYVRARLDVTVNDGTDVVSLTCLQGCAHAAPVLGNEGN